MSSLGLTRFLFIILYLSLIRFTKADDTRSTVALRENQDVKPLSDVTDRDQPFFAVIKPLVGADQGRVPCEPGGGGKIDPVFLKVCGALDLVLSQLHAET